MNVLIIQEAGRHEANKNFRECFCLQRAFIKSGIECDIWGLGHDNYSENINFHSYDLILNLENWDETGWVPDLSQVNSKKFLWSVDAHVRGEKIFEDTFASGRYDLLLHSTKDFARLRHHRWFPNAFDDTLLKPLEEVKKEHFIGFCGNLVNRSPVLDYLDSQSFKIRRDIFVIGEEMVKAINSYSIHFNYNISNDINYRTFETIGCKTVLLTNYNRSLEELGFVNSENCILYDDPTKIPSVLNFYKSRPDLLASVADRGYALSKLHTYEKRAGIILDFYDET